MRKNPFVPSPSAGCLQQPLGINLGRKAEVEGLLRAKQRSADAAGPRLRSAWSLDYARDERCGVRSRMWARSIGLIVAVLALAAPASAQLGAATQSPPPEGVAPGEGAGHPKGNYHALDALPDWGGIWFVQGGASGGGGPPAVPKLK